MHGKARIQYVNVLALLREQWMLVSYRCSSGKTTRVQLCMHIRPIARTFRRGVTWVSHV